ncbi:MAG: pyridoxal phosphate-dependent aminotransferase [Acidobacteria bacterium]|nr:pyridoxal phosphate-dependent aminotransferase [Acidobacteriota bacterium]
MRLSRRLNWRGETNAIARAIEHRRASGRQLVDLTISNPTAVGFEPPPGLAESLKAASVRPYEPDPRGSQKARVALAAWLFHHGVENADPDEIVLASSTSEAYGWILKLLCDPDDQVLRFAPTYPLLDHLCALEAVRLNTLELERTGDGWNVVDDEALREGLNRSKAVIVVHPNNPTGHFFSPRELGSLSNVAERYGAALIADEVFFEYGRVERRRAASDTECLTFSLGGLSKSAALPHWKLGWIRITGPQEQKRRAVEALELIADTYLPVAGPVQHALPEILAMTETIRRPILERIETNLRTIDEAVSGIPSIRREAVDGGWSAILRVPLLESEESLILDLIDAGVIVHPGYFYDFPGEGRVVVSLLTREEEMKSGMELFRGTFAKRL